MGDPSEGRFEMKADYIPGSNFEYEAEEKTTFWPLWIVLIGALELNKNAVKGWVDPSEGKFEMKADYIPGSNFEMGPWTRANGPANYSRRQNAELNNGRLAMIAVALLVLREKITGLAVAGDFEQASALREVPALLNEIAGSQ